MINNEQKEEFAKIEKMNSRERLSYIRELLHWHQMMLRDENSISKEVFDDIVQRVDLVTKGTDGEAIPALV